MNCVCGHSRGYHGWVTYPRRREPCEKLLCCDRRLDTGIGRNGREHDGVTHQRVICPCQNFQQEETQQEKEVTA